MSSYELIVFDWDGTLSDSVTRIVSCMHRALADVGARADESDILQTIGLPMTTTADQLLDGNDAELKASFRQHYTRYWLETAGSTQWFDGVPGMIETLEARGLLLAVATGKSRPGLDREMDFLEAEAWFQASRTASEAPAKPSPVMLLEICDELGVVPERALMVGDTDHDLQMANNAGAPAVGVASGSQSRNQLEPCRPLAILDTVRELIAWLDAPDS